MTGVWHTSSCVRVILLYAHIGRAARDAGPSLITDAVSKMEQSAVPMELAAV